MLVGSLVTVLVEMRRQKAESTRQEQALAAERQRLQSAFAHDSGMRQLEWRRAERKVVIDRARAFLDGVSLVVQQIAVQKASQAVSGQSTEDKVSCWVWRMADVLNRSGGV
jgi:hypothetical protein